MKLKFSVSLYFLDLVFVDVGFAQVVADVKSLNDDDIFKRLCEFRDFLGHKVLSKSKRCGVLPAEFESEDDWREHIRNVVEDFEHVQGVSIEIQYMLDKFILPYDINWKWNEPSNYIHPYYPQLMNAL